VYASRQEEDEMISYDRKRKEKKRKEKKRKEKKRKKRRDKSSDKMCSALCFCAFFVRDEDTV
jgi:hypothetical protein